jgi:hypothetical protein
MSGFKVPPLYLRGFKTTWIAYTLLFSFGSQHLNSSGCIGKPRE